MSKIKQRISNCLWFDNRAEEAAKFYTSIFKNSSVGKITRYGKAGFEFHKQPEGTVMTVEFTLDGQEFMGLNGGPIFKFNESVSLVVHCANQEEVDYYWSKLTQGGEESQCGWLKDKFGLSWQVVPDELSEMVSDPDKEKADRVMNAFMQMRKFDLEKLRKAYNGEAVEA